MRRILKLYFTLLLLAPFVCMAVERYFHNTSPLTAHLELPVQTTVASN